VSTGTCASVICSPQVFAFLGLEHPSRDACPSSPRPSRTIETMKNQQSYGGALLLARTRDVCQGRTVHSILTVDKRRHSRALAARLNATKSRAPISDRPFGRLSVTIDWDSLLLLESIFESDSMDTPRELIAVVHLSDWLAFCSHQTSRNVRNHMAPGNGGECTLMSAIETAISRRPMQKIDRDICQNLFAVASCCFSLM
jgi:hypothetical protein